jgi:MoaA/NifB/PqqE/SkfB family radical SAM enzyme
MSHRFRFYEEAPIFDAFTRFDTETGHLTAISEGEFRRAQAGSCRATAETAPGIARSESEDRAVFCGETSPRRTRFPRRVYFQITRHCNLSCPYCYLKSGPGEAHVPTPAVIGIAAFLARNGLAEVRLTGGEPTSHPDFFEIVDAFRDQGVFVSVATNGLLARRTLDALAERPGLWVICSVDGDAATHDAYRRGTFARVVANLGYLKQRSPTQRLRLTTVLTRRNQHQIRALAETACAVGAESVTVIPLRPQLRDPALRADMITAGEFRGVLAQIAAVTRELGVRMTTTLATDYEASIHPDPLVRKRSACAAGREATNLDYDACRGVFLVYGCSYSPAPDLQAPAAVRRPFLAGEFAPGREEEFFRIWRDDGAWAIYREPAFKAAVCQACSYYLNQQCVGSCPIQNVDYASLKADQNILDQLRCQLSQTAEWYCYQGIFSL